MKKTEYKVGDVVWGKWGVHQRWPARVLEIVPANNKLKAKIQLIGKKLTTCEYTNSLEPFTGSTKSGLRGDPDFQDAVQAALKIRESKSTPEGCFKCENR